MRFSCPTMNFFCQACEMSFSKVLTPTEYEGGKVVGRIAAAKKWKHARQLSTLSQQESVPDDWLHAAAIGKTVSIPDAFSRRVK